MRLLASISLAMLFSVTSPAQTHNSGRLPVRRVVLYKNGVGYFEHSTRVQGTQELNIDFTTAQLNDVLMSLTVVDLGEGRISSVRYNSIAPLGERLKGLRLPFGEDVGREDFLTAMRGARVDVRSGSAIASGKLLSVEKVKHQSAKSEDLYETIELAIVTDAGEMRSFVLSPLVSVRLADHELTSEVGRYLDLLGSSRARDLRQMTITAAGTGDRNIFVSYISEVPIWKSTYRIILPDETGSKPGAKPLLQGWAIVDNTIGEDWKDVHLSLVAGAPQSFVQNISQPFYARRPEIPLPQSAQLTPQTHEAAVGNMLALSPGIADRLSHATTSLQGIVTDMSGASVPGARVTIRNEETGVSQISASDTQGHFHFSDIQAGNSGLFVSAPGYKVYNLTNVYLGIGRTNEINARLEVGSTTTTVEVTAAAPTLETSSASLSSVATRQAVEAEGKSAGDFFEYAVKQTITIGQNQSALVPILQAPIETEKVTVVNPDSPPLLALWVKNTSGQILDSGSFNVLEGDTFAGEGVLEVLHPNERRLLSYAGDSAIHLKTLGDSSTSPYTAVRIFKGNVMLVREERKSTRYMMRNADSKPRVVVVEHASQEGEGWKLNPNTQKPEETTASFYRFRINVDPGKTAELAVDESHPLTSSTELSDLDDDQVKVLVDANRITPAMKKAFDDVLAQKRQVGALDLQLRQHDEEIKKINTDQGRLRENMKALKGSAEEKILLERYIGELNSQEDRLAALRGGTEALQAQRNQAQGELDRLIEGVDLDEHF